MMRFTLTSGNSLRYGTIYSKTWSRSFSSPSVCSIIPVPMNLGQPNLGLDKAPDSLIESGLPKAIGSLGWSINQAKPIFTDKFRASDDAKSRTNYLQMYNARNCYQVGKVSQIINETVTRECEDDNVFPLILGGDHGISIGTISALAARVKRNGNRIGVIWVDAHADINTPEGSASGNMHGMPLAFLSGLVKDANKLPGFDWIQPVLNPSEDIVYIGLRDVDSYEKRVIKDYNIKTFTMYDIDKLGIGKVMEQTLDYLKGRDLHLSFDIDSLDPFYAPHTGTAVTGGLTFREGNYVSEAIMESGQLRSMELVEVDPMQHKNIDPKQTIETASMIICSALGQTILGQ